MINTAGDFDAFEAWLSSPGTRLLRFGSDLTVASSAALPAGATEDWKGLNMLDFLRSRFTLTDDSGIFHPEELLTQEAWEGSVSKKATWDSGRIAELFYIREKEGSFILRWRYVPNDVREDNFLLEHIFNSLTQGMMITDLEGTVLRINPAIYGRMRQRIEDRLGKAFWDSHEWIAVPGSTERAKKDIRRAALGEKVTEIYQTMPFGERYVHLKLQMHPVIDDKGTIRYIAIEGTPVTQEVEDKKELDLQRTLIRTFFEFIPLPIWLVDVRGKLIMMNDAYAEVYGLADADIGRNIYAQRSEKISEQCIRNNLQVFRSGIPLHSVEYIKDLKGETRIFHVTKFPVGTSEGEALIGGVSLDMTDKINADQQLRKALERFEYVSQATNDLIYDWNIQSGIVKLVGNAFGIYDELKDKEIGMSELQTYIHSEDLARLSKKLEKSIKNKQRMDWHAEFRIRDRDEGYLNVMDRASIHRDGTGMAFRVVGSIQDISAIHKLNQRFQETQKIDFQRSQQVAYEVAERERNRIAEELHDHVNPLLAAARLHIGVSESSPEHAFENLGQSKTLIFDAIDMIRNLSQRISIGMLKDRPLDVILRGFLKKIHSGDHPAVEVTGKKLDGLKDLYFNMNILRIVQEQLVNTLRYADAKNFLVDIAVKTNQLHLQIRDDGRGFDTTKGYGGLGLPEISGRVEAYGGRIRIQSGEGKGCRLDIVIPVSEKISNY